MVTICFVKFSKLIRLDSVLAGEEDILSLLDSPGPDESSSLPGDAEESVPPGAEEGSDAEEGDADEEDGMEELE